VKLSKYCLIYPDLTDHKMVVLYSTKKASAVRIDKSMLAGIQKGQLEDEERQTLTELGFLVASDFDENTEMLRFIDYLNDKDPGLSLILVMNLDCNLACPYCFEGSRRGKHYMSRETSDNIIVFVEKQLRKDKEEFRVDFYGGEPLLSVDLIHNMAEQLKEIADAKGKRFSFSVTTNGTLLNEHIVVRLKPLGLEYASITLDGPEEIHNKSRPYATGAGSFGRIIDNIMEIYGDIGVNIGGNYREDNYMEFPRLLDYLLQKGLTPDKIGSIEFAPVVRERAGIALPDFVGGCVDLHEPWLLEATLYLRHEIMKRGFPTRKIAPSLCAVDRKSALVVNYDGAIYKCPGVIGQAEFKIGDVVSGVGDYTVSHGMANWKNDECLNCVYLPLCFGGCRYMSLLTSGSIAGLDCRKAYYEESFEMFVRQDLEISRKQTEGK
jgi:uncharacterized protein